MIRYLLLLLVAGCGAARDDNTAAAPLTAAAQSAGAEFRWQARQAYQVLDDPCDFAPGFARARVLAAERRAFADFESRLAGTPAKLLMDVARADVAYAEGLPPQRRCDTSLASPAETRIGFARRDVNVALDRMQALVPDLAGFPVSAEISPRDGAELRHLARQVVEILTAQCPFSLKQDEFHTLARPRAELSRFRREVGGTPYAPHFAMAEADVAYEHSITMVECIAPDTPDTADLIRAVTARVATAIGRMRRISTGR